ncbi:MAG: HEAT repeat domain-containing protein [Pirellulales bacterium]
MWALQGHRVVDQTLLGKILALPSENARAAAVKVVVDERDTLPEAQALLQTYAVDESPRVRLEAIRGLSFFRKPEATDAVLAAAKMPMDKWLRHEIVCALGATETAWTGRYVAKKIAQDDKNVAGMLDDIIKGSKTIGAAVPYMQTLLGKSDAAQEEKNKAMAALAAMKGNADKGKTIIKSLTCMGCHKIGEEGKAYGPASTKSARGGIRPKLSNRSSNRTPNCIRTSSPPKSKTPTARLTSDWSSTIKGTT